MQIGVGPRGFAAKSYRGNSEVRGTDGRRIVGDSSQAVRRWFWGSSICVVYSGAACEQQRERPHHRQRDPNAHRKAKQGAARHTERKARAGPRRRGKHAGWYNNRIPWVVQETRCEWGGEHPPVSSTRGGGAWCQSGPCSIPLRCLLSLRHLFLPFFLTRGASRIVEAQTQKVSSAQSSENSARGRPGRRIRAAGRPAIQE
jgi:hypothetical protein